MDKRNKPVQLMQSIYLLCVVFIIIGLFNPAKSFIQSKIKKQSLRTFYTYLATAEDQNNWSKIYDFLPNSTKKFVSREQYINFQSKNQNIPYSSKTVINNVEFKGDNGTVNMTNTSCLTSNCTGSDKNIITGNFKYIYIDNQWTLPDKLPSDIALKNADFIYSHLSQDGLTTFVKNWSNYGVADPNYLINNYALHLDQDPVLMAKVENWIDQYNTNQQQKTVVRTVNIPAPVFHEPQLVIPPARQIKTTHCSTVGFGQYASVNCTTY